MRIIIGSTSHFLTFVSCLAVTLSGFGQPTLPGFVRQPTNYNIFVGASTVAFSVIATGAPPPSFQWRLRDSDLPGQTNSSLSVINAQFINAGPYSVVATNDSGAVTSAIAWLSVLPTNVVNLGARELRFGELSATNWAGTRKDDQSQSVTGDGLTLFYASTAPGGSGGLDIWMVTRPTLTSPWGTPVNLGPTINSSADDTDPRLSPDGLSLYFDSTRSGGYGGFDIWMATRPTLTAAFGPPINLGSAINGGVDDGVAQITADNRTLVFSRFTSMQPEVWMSTRTNVSAPWGQARHLPAPINHAGDTFATAISRDGLLLFLKSWRPVAFPTGAPEPSAIYVCGRSSTDQDFGSPVIIQPILGIGTGGADACSLSDDGTTLYVGTYRTVYPDWAEFVKIDITLLPQLSTPREIAAGQFQFDLIGREGANYEIQVSSDLSTWNPWLLTNSSSRVQLLDAASAAKGHRFYRALSH